MQAAHYTGHVDKVGGAEHTTRPFENPDSLETRVANTKSAEKAARRAETNRARNVALRSRMRSALRKVNDALAAGNKADAMAALKEAQPLVDSLVNKNVIHRNKAARHKSALAARIKALPAPSK